MVVLLGKPQLIDNSCFIIYIFKLYDWSRFESEVIQLLHLIKNYSFRRFFDYYVLSVQEV